MNILAEIGPTTVIGAVIIGLLLGGCLVGIVYQMISKAKAKTFEHDLERQVEGAKREAENIIKSAQIDAAAETIKKKEEFTAEANKTRADLHEAELRLTKREDALERQMEQTRQRENAVKQQQQENDKRVRNIAVKEKQLTVLMAQQKNQLLKITAMDINEAKDLLLKRLEDECEHEMSSVIQRKVEEATEMADDKCREVISTAIQRFAAEQTCDVTVSTVEIPNDDMKGRIIGREGRNIRAFEKATGVDVIVDDTPGMIVVSGFNPVRREVARLSMERLIQDGRIHPAIIEEVVRKVTSDIEKNMFEEGEKAAFELEIPGLPRDALMSIGKLKYRTSYGQNVLSHSREVANLAGIMAGELTLDIQLAKRSGLLHDIGKGLDAEGEGAHATVGAEMARKFGENKQVENIIASHHNDKEPESFEAVLIQVADTISASRPGARRESINTYIKRLENLESIASGFKGVEKCFAIQAGREVRVIVENQIVSDEKAEGIARDIAGKIESDLKYPGIVKVTVIRETRVINYAR